MPSPPNSHWHPCADIFWTPFFLLWYPFGALFQHKKMMSMPLVPFWHLWVPFWCHFGSMLVHLAPFWKPKTNSAANDSKTKLWFICFDYFTICIVFKRISADLCIDLAIVFEPNLYYLPPLIFFILNPQPHNPKPHNPKHPQT